MGSEFNENILQEIFFTMKIFKIYSYNIMAYS